MDDLHSPVLLEKVLDALQVKPEGIYIDGTFGRGGHAAVLLERLGSDGKLLAFDKDPRAVAYAAERFGDEPRLMVRHGSFAGLGGVVSELGWQGRVSGILLDLGVSSMHLDNAERGFSFRQDGPLDMRMDQNSGQPVSDDLNEKDASELAEIIKIKPMKDVNPHETTPNM